MKAILFPLGFGLLVGLLLFGNVILSLGRATASTHSMVDAYSFGKQCHKYAVPATANPYVGTDRFLADGWLRGWVEGAKDHEGK